MPQPFERLAAKTGVHLRDAGQEAILYDTYGRKVHVLNSTAAWIWKLCSEGKNRSEISTALSERYGLTTAAAEADVDEMIGTFTALELLTPVPAQAALAG
jgi:hypothetical protein